MSDEQYTPSVGTARDAYVLMSMSVRVSTRPSEATVGAEFDRMIADVARRAKAEERERIAQAIEANTQHEVRYTLGGNSKPTQAQETRAGVIRWFGKSLALLARADRIESEVTSP